MSRGAAAVAAALTILAAALGLAATDHRGAFPALPKSPEILYLPSTYKACIPCHPRAVFEDEDFNADTLFRDTGLGKNLHWMHVFRQPQGTNCSGCHRVDEASGALLYDPRAGHEKKDTGGTCAPACHRPKEYKNGNRSGS